MTAISLALLLAAGLGQVEAGDAPYRDVVCQPAYDWDCGKALRVMACESRGDPNAYAAGNYGLYQIHYPSHAGRVDGPTALFDPETNIKVAYAIWSAQGWAPWGCRGA